MFTGIIETIGVVQGLKKSRGGSLLTLRVSRSFSSSLMPGASVAVNGACLTVARRRNREISFQIVEETLKRTTLGSLRPGLRAHVERPLRAGQRMNGHFVQGHVDGTSRVRHVLKKGRGLDLVISFPVRLRPFLLEKGSVAVDGVSLTIGRVSGNAFWLHLVPYTLKKTRLGRLKAGDRVNLEADILVKLLARVFRR